jgi:hypothetical protein
MSGKRRSYVNPFSYYIFISFLTFFIPFLLVYPDGQQPDKVKSKMEKMNKAAIKDSIVVENREVVENAKGLPRVKGLDSNEIINAVAKNLENEERKEKALEFFTHNLPKVLFIYMPIFAFWMWLFHNRKKCYYFDSGIFTLNFFSVVLLSITICILFN